MLSNAQQCSEMLSNAQQYSAMLSNAQQYSAMLAQRCSAMLLYILHFVDFVGLLKATGMSAM